MNEGQDHGHGDESHTVDEAAAAIEGLSLFDDEDTQPDDAEIDETQDEPDDEVDAEGADDEEEPSDEPDAEPDDDEEEPVEEPVTPRTRKLKVNGEEIEVTDEELEKGYSRTADYTRKTQKHADEVRTFEAERSAVRAERERYATSLVELENVLKASSQEPDWDKLKDENPDEFPAAFASWQVHKQRIEGVEKERQKAVEAVQADRDTQHKAYLTGERDKLFEAIPAWKDAEVGKKERAELLTYGQEFGYTEDELRGVVDHRALIMLRKAMLYDAAEKAKTAKAPKVLAKIDKAKVVAPGPGGKLKPKSQALTRANQRLSKTGSVDDAASALSLMDFGLN